MMKYLALHGVEAFGWTRQLGDLRDLDTVKRYLAEFKPTRILHLAARPVGADSDQWGVVADEQRMLTNLAITMPLHCQLIYSGTMAEYGRSGYFDESDWCAPDTAYGCAKYSCSTLALAMRSMRSLDIRVARLFGVFGPGEHAQRLLPSVIARLLRGEEIRLSDGLQVRDFIHVDDVCEALWQLFDANELPGNLVNVGTGAGVSVRHVCLMVADILGADADLLKFGAIERRPVDQDCLVAITDRLKTIMDPAPQRWATKELAVPCVNGFLSSATI
jgi:nucleoside-diphosphate-sugar epimerase